MCTADLKAVVASLKMRVEAAMTMVHRTWLPHRAFPVQRTVECVPKHNLDCLALESEPMTMIGNTSRCTAKETSDLCPSRVWTRVVER